MVLVTSIGRFIEIEEIFQILKMSIPGNFYLLQNEKLL